MLLSFLVAFIKYVWRMRFLLASNDYPDVEDVRQDRTAAKPQRSQYMVDRNIHKASAITRS